MDILYQQLSNLSSLQSALELSRATTRQAHSPAVLRKLVQQADFLLRLPRQLKADNRLDLGELLLLMIRNLSQEPICLGTNQVSTTH